MRTKNIIHYVSMQDQILVWREMKRLEIARRAKSHSEASVERDTYHLREVKKENEP